MTKPEPRSIDPQEVRELALAVMQADKAPHLATIGFAQGDEAQGEGETEGSPQPRVRPVSPVRTEGFVVYIANLRMYQKTAEIESNPRVELCYMDEGHNQVRLTGVAEPVIDEALIRDIHANHNLLRQYLPDPMDPNLIIYRVTPRHVRYMQEWALSYYEVAGPLE